MKKEELRIGNLVFDRKVPIDLKPSQMVNIITGIHTELYKPIPLTEDWLLKFGFVKIEETYTLELNNYLTALFTDLDLKTLLIEDAHNDSINIKMPNYVHQLQNLYFALTGSELIFSV